MIRLIHPALEHEEQVLAYKAAFLESGENMAGTGDLREAKTYGEWLETLHLNAAEETVRPGLSPATTLLGVNESGEVVGMVDIRHRLTDYLFHYGGHIGYSVHPAHRRKGYAAAILAQAVEKSRKLGISRCLVVCNKENIGSARTILRNGGVLENEVWKDDHFIQRYWIETPAICAVEREDLPACVDMIRKSFATVAEEFDFTPENAPRFTAFATTEDRLAWQMKHDRPMLAWWEDGRIAGYYSLEMKSETCELNNLCVLPEKRHSGIGKALLQDAFSRAKAAGCRNMHIGIVAENLRLRRWYETHGFVYTREEKFDFFPFTCGYMEREL